MVVFDSEYVIGFFVFDQEAGGFFLSMHCISSNHSIFDVQLCQQRLNTRNFVGLLPDGYLGYDNSLL